MIPSEFPLLNFTHQNEPNHLYILPQRHTMQMGSSNNDNGTNHPHVDLCLPVTLPGALLAPASSTSSSLTTRRSSANSSTSMQTSYRLPHPLPPLPVRKGVRGRRPKSQTIALLKAAAEAAAAAAAVNGAAQSPGRTVSEAPMAPRPHKKRGPKPKNKVRCHQWCSPAGHGQVTLTLSILLRLYMGCRSAFHVVSAYYGILPLERSLLFLPSAGSHWEEDVCWPQVRGSRRVQFNCSSCVCNGEIGNA